MKKKSTNKIIVISLILFFISSIFSNSLAINLKTSLDIVQKASETKYLDNNQGNISKKIVDSNPDTGEVSIELKLENIKKEKEQKQIFENTEVYLLVSENISSDDKELSKYINNIEKLTSKIFKTNANTKVGIIGIKGTICDSYIDKSGKQVTGEKDEGDVPGRVSDSEIVVELTNNVDSIKNGLQKMNSSKTKYYNNLQSAIRLANNSYSKNTNKILISLFDDVPLVSIGVKVKVNVGWFSEYTTLEEGVKDKHEKIATNTKKEILTLKESNVSFILLRPGDTSYNENWYNSSGEKVLEFDGSPYVKDLYGTIENPTYGKMYSFKDSNIDNIITENIYQDVKQKIQPDITNVKIIDYFPKEIIENFEFSYVNNPKLGSVSETIDKTNNTITWDIDKLKGNEVATLRYKLKIKDIKNVKILNKTISTNEKVILTYKDIAAKDFTLTLSSSPKIKLSEKIEENVNQTKTNGSGTTNIKSNDIDTTIAKGILPKTGAITIISTIFLIIVFSAIAYKKYNSFRDIK